MTNILFPYFADMVASQKFISGDWFVVPHEGQIYNKYHEPITGTDSNGYAVIGTHWYREKVNIMYHRAVWIGANGGRIPDKELQVDHINGDRKDNRIDNLRLATPKENINNPNTLWKRKGGRSVWRQGGDEHPGERITYETVMKVRHLYDSTRNKTRKEGRLSFEEIGLRTGMSGTSARRIALRITYKSVPEQEATA